MNLVLNARGVNSFVVPVTAQIDSITIQNGSPGQFVTLLFIQDGTGHTVSAGGGNLVGLLAVPSGAFDVNAQSFTYDSQSNDFINIVPAAAGLLIEVAGVPLSSQKTLNFTAGANVTLTDEGGGTMQIAASGGSSLTTRVTVVVTSAQLLALAETPINIIPTPGSGKFIDVRGCTFEMKFGTTAYTVTATALALVYHGGDPTMAALAGVSPSILSQTANAVAVSVETLSDFGIGIVAETVVDDVAVDLATDVDPTLGDGTLVVTVDYAVITLT